MSNVKEYIKQQNERIKALEESVNKLTMNVRASKKRRFNKKTQNANWTAMNRALCVDTIDPWKENRVRFYCPLLHNPDTPILGLPFARPISTMGGFDDCGLNWVPPAGSTLCLVFEGGHRDAPYYLGTMWPRYRGAGGSELGYPVQEYYKIYSGHRGGYLVGPNDESQSLPQWVSESYNNYDTDSFAQFSNNPDEQRKITAPNIYGFKTPEKHMLKMVDGNPKCDRRWKRMELMSGCGNWMIFKDDHLHYGGQWAHPSCPPTPGGGDVSDCAEGASYFTDPFGKPIEQGATCDGQASSGKIIGGHPSTPGNPPKPTTTHFESQGGANPYFRHENECRPYKGPGTPQNNKCDLPQSGFQLLSISGYTIVADDSVEEPRGTPIWERSKEDFDFGCNDKFLGRFYIKSATGHAFVMSDVEKDTGLRGDQNYIDIRSATGNFIQLNDHTIGEKGGTPCPPNYAGEQRGVHIGSTSGHEFNMCDHMNQQCSPNRKEGGEPVRKATEAFINLKTGYGSEIRMSDDHSQEKTQSQWIQITNPQSAGESDPEQNPRGEHFLRFQARPSDQPGIVYLRAGGHSIRTTYDMDIVLVGDKEKNPADKFTYVSKVNVSAVEENDFRYSGKMHILFAEEQILLMAGRDCAPAEGKKCRGPCLYPVIVARCPVICPYTGYVHWTEKAMSERVFASAKNIDICEGGSGTTTEGEAPPCREDNQEQEYDTGNGIVTIDSPDTTNDGTQPGPGPVTEGGSTPGLQ